MQDITPKKLAGVLAAVTVLFFVIAGYAQDAGMPPPDAPAAPEAAAKMEGDPYEMNGIRFKDYADFQSKWQLVTVRYRTDTGEQRFVYANPAAWDALTHGVIDYPDGAVFAKIGIMTREDPGFTSSKVPAGASRVQFMVRDKAKYISTDGWGYALFAPVGMRLSAEPVPEQSAACAACHEVVPDRGYVFSQPVGLLAEGGLPARETRPPETTAQAATPPAPHAPLFFVDAPLNALPSSIQRGLKPRIKTGRNLSTVMRLRLFSGTMNEIMPMLIKEADRSGQPAVLAAADGSRYVVIAKADDAADPGEAATLSCAKGEKKYLSLDFSNSSGLSAMTLGPALPASIPTLGTPAPDKPSSAGPLTVSHFFCND